MNVDNLKRKIKSEIKKNNENMEIIKSRIDVLNNNTLLYDSLKTLFGYGGVYIASFCSLLVCISKGIVPIASFVPLSIVIPTIGTIAGKSIINKISIKTGPLRKFSSAKNNQEICEELIKYNIEFEKLTTTNKVLTDFQSKIEEQSASLANDDNKSIIEIDNDINDINVTIEKNKETTHLLSASKVLKTNHSKKGNADKIYNTLCTVMLGSIIGFCLNQFPVTFMAETTNIQLPCSAIGLLSCATLGGIAGFTIIKTIQDDEKNALNKVSSQYNFNDELEIDYEKELDKTLIDTCNLRLSLEAKKQTRIRRIALFDNTERNLYDSILSFENRNSFNNIDSSQKVYKKEIIQKKD